MTREAKKHKALEENKKKVAYNHKVLDDRKAILDQYPNLYKTIKGICSYLWEFNLHSGDRLFNVEYQINGDYYFFVSNRHLEKLFRFSKYNTWNTNINVFCTLGLVYKLKNHEIADWLLEASQEHRRILAERLNLPLEKVKEVNYYSIPLYTKRVLEEADNIAKVLISHNFKLKHFNKMYLIKTFDQEFADNVFPDERKVTASSEYVAKQIEKFILREIKRHGYTTNERILTKTYINLSKVMVSTGVANETSLQLS